MCEQKLLTLTDDGYYIATSQYNNNIDYSLYLLIMAIYNCIIGERINNYDPCLRCYDCLENFFFYESFKIYEYSEQNIITCNELANYLDNWINQGQEQLYITIH